MSSIYFAQSFDGGPIKIGRSARPEHRLRTLQSGSPVELDLLCVVPGDEVVEGVFHQLFADGRLHGEWFAEDTAGLAELIEHLIIPDFSIPAVMDIHWAMSELARRSNKAEPTASLAKATAGSDNEGV